MNWRNHIPEDRRRDFRETERKAKAAARRESKAERLARARDVLQTTEAKFRKPRERDASFLSWLHEDLPCIACLIEGAPANPGSIEAAHQKLNIAAKGWSKVSGVRAHDRQCVPLCRFHHQDAPNACDKGQRQFWDRLGIGDGVADLCTDLYHAFKGGNPGGWVIDCYAEEASRGFPPSRTRKHAEDDAR